MTNILKIVIATSLAGLIPSSAQALQPKHDLLVHIVNATRHTFELCNLEQTSCHHVLPGATETDAQATDNHAAAVFQQWLLYRVIRACDKSATLQEMMIAPVQLPDDRHRSIYRLSVTEEHFLKACKQPTGAH